MLEKEDKKLIFDLTNSDEKKLENLENFKNSFLEKNGKLENSNFQFGNFDEKNVLELKDSKLEQIIYYERKYKMNSFDIIYSTIDSDEKNKWKELILEFLRLNGDVRLINSIVPVMYFGFSMQDKKKTSEMAKSIFNYFDRNSAICVSNKNPLYKKIISLMNSKRKIVILFTNNEKDFDLDFSNLVVCFSKKPNFSVANFCSKYFYDEEKVLEPLGKLEKFKNKILYL